MRTSKKPVRSSPVIAVLGAGHGGLAMAAHLAIMGHEVRLWNRNRERIEPILQRGSVDVEGAVQGTIALALATSDIEEAVADASIIMVVVPANAHSDIAALLSPHLKAGQIVVLNPGRTGGALEVSKVFRENGVSPKVIVAEAQTFLYVSRRVAPTEAKIFQIKNSVPLAALPAFRTPEVLRTVNSVFPQFVAGTNVLQTSFDNIGMVFHPAVMLLNAAWVEAHHDFEYYIEGISPSVASLLGKLDEERRAVAASIGVNTHSAREWLYLVYNAAGRTLYEAVQATPGYAGVQAPNTLFHRYLLEDVPMSLVPLSETGRQYGVATPTTNAVIHLASELLDRDFRKEGRTLERMGIKGLSVKLLRKRVAGGFVPRAGADKVRAGRGGAPTPKGRGAK